MRNLVICLLTLLLFTQCHEANNEPAAAALFIGTWKNVANEHTIAFDEDHNYAVKFRSDTVFQFKYRLDDLEKDHHLFIYDALVTQEYAYQFLEDDQLQLTQLSPPGFSDMEKNIVLFQRVR
ncbi:hypothetical protein [Catalinimonas niigatensis]|uniref:hypothetical protein n=1 Tax=Catalinimonas niigatensis TaxID=1397264 RepID=UPI0026654315|nr:hypothetical protein [Catalinimonas niigatensis]WPP50462.1 hypothetical protein PZB72_27730 [Catalinimonas niigatensis]